MNGVLATASPSSLSLVSPVVQFRKTSSNVRFGLANVRASGGQNDGGVSRARIVEKIKRAAGVVVLTAATAAMIGKFGNVTAWAETPRTTVSEESLVEEDKAAAVNPMAELLQTNSEAVEALKALLMLKLDNREDGEALKILSQLVEAQPEVAEWLYLKARLLNEMDLTKEARNAFEQILKADPLNYEVLFENALLMNRCGEGAAVIKRLEEARRIAEQNGKGKEGRDVRLIIAQMQFLMNYADEALSSYDELIREDPNDFRPYFSKGVIYGLLDRNDEAKEEFTKYKKLSPEKLEVEKFLRTPLARMLVFGNSNPDQI